MTVLCGGCAKWTNTSVCGKCGYDNTRRKGPKDEDHVAPKQEPKDEPQQQPENEKRNLKREPQEVPSSWCGAKRSRDAAETETPSGPERPGRTDLDAAAWQAYARSYEVWAQDQLEAERRQRHRAEAQAQLRETDYAALQTKYPVVIITCVHYYSCTSASESPQRL